MTVNRAAHLFQRVRAEHNESDADLLRRFAELRDATAFAVLVHRHGPLVLGVCRRTLGHAHDAEDAFQAVFLVLAQKAGTLRDTRLLSAWLYGVAWRIAKKARRRAARRREESRTVVPEPTAMDEPVNDVLPVLDEELAALPEAYRYAILACDVEQLSRTDAAAKLGIPEGTLSSRLATGRKRLAERLARRGVTLTLFATLTTAGVSEAMIQQTVATVATWVAGGGVAKPIAELTHEGLTMLRKVLLLGTGVLAAGVVGVGLADDPTKPPPEKKPAEVKTDAKPTEGVRYGVPKMKQSVELTMDRLESLTWLPDGKRFAVIGNGRIKILRSDEKNVAYTVGTGVFFYPADPPTANPVAVYRPRKGETVLHLAADGRGVMVTTGSTGRINSQKRVGLVPVFDADGKSLQDYPIARANPEPTTALPLEPEYGDAVGYTADGKTLATFEKPTDDTDARLVLRSADTGEPRKTLPLGRTYAVTAARDFTRLCHTVWTKPNRAVGSRPRGTDQTIERIDVLIDGPKPTTWTAKIPEDLDFNTAQFTPDGERLILAFGNWSRGSRGATSSRPGSAAPQSVIVGYAAASGKELFRYTSTTARSLSDVQVSFDGRLVAAREIGDSLNALIIIDTAAGTVLKRWPLSATVRESVSAKFLWAFSPTEPKLLVVEPGEESGSISVGLWEFPKK